MEYKQDMQLYSATNVSVDKAAQFKVPACNMDTESDWNGKISLVLLISFILRHGLSDVI
jgi:hypothetical protein